AHVAEQTLAAFVRSAHRPLAGRILLDPRESRPTGHAQPFFRVLLAVAEAEHLHLKLQSIELAADLSGLLQLCTMPTIHDPDEKRS
ncbi:MAG: hypothetical protein ACLGJC_22065, partial [Alphaproteobacteria bacterium]